MSSKLRNHCNVNHVDGFHSTVSHKRAHSDLNDRKISHRQLKVERPRLVGCHFTL